MKGRREKKEKKVEIIPLILFVCDRQSVITVLNTSRQEKPIKCPPDDAVIILCGLVSCSGFFVFPISLFGLSVLCMEFGRGHLS